MIRIVKLTFKPEYRDDFLKFISFHKDKIQNFEGCCGVDFLNSIDNANVFFTYSTWENERYLEKYRNSSLFQMVWTEVKQWFGDKPEAWSVESIKF